MPLPKLTIRAEKSALLTGGMPESKLIVGVVKSSVISDIPSGSGVITGVLDVNDVLSARVVRLYVKQTGVFVAKTISDPNTGVYVFTGLSKEVPFYTTGHDHNNVYESDIADNLYAT